MKYVNLMTLKELLNLVSLGNFIVVENDKKIKNYKENADDYIIEYISSTSNLEPTLENWKYETETKYKPYMYKKINTLENKDYCVKSEVVIYVRKATNEVLCDEKN